MWHVAWHVGRHITSIPYTAWHIYSSRLFTCRVMLRFWFVQFDVEFCVCFCFYLLVTVQVLVLLQLQLLFPVLVLFLALVMLYR